MPTDHEHNAEAKAKGDPGREVAEWLMSRS